jgi:hypothetical protein
VNLQRRCHGSSGFAADESLDVHTEPLGEHHDPEGGEVTHALIAADECGWTARSRGQRR